MIKKFFSIVMAAFILVTLAGCSVGKNKESFSSGDFKDHADLPLPSEYVQAHAIGGEVRKGFGLIVEGNRYDLYRSSEGYSVRIVSVNGNSYDVPAESDVLFLSDAPVIVRIKPVGADEEKEYCAEYRYLYGSPSALCAVGIIDTENGSVIEVTDRYTVVGAFLKIERKATIVKAAAKDEGFSSVISFRVNEGDDSYDCMEYFIPGVWYKDTSLNAPGGIASGYRNKSIFVKETRAGLPLVMERSKETGRTLAIGRLNGEISSDVSDKISPAFLTDENYRVGSVGVTRGPTPAVGYAYPCSEHPWVYQSSYSVAQRYHPIRQGFSSSYGVTLYSAYTENFNAAMQDVYVRFYEEQNKPVYTPDLDIVYDEVIKTFHSYYAEKDTVYGKICGLPYGCFVTDGHVESGLTMEMGFVGMEISVAYQLIRYGAATGEEEYIREGKAMADMWAERSLTDSGVVKPYLFGDGNFSTMPCYLRRMNDGMEGLLDCIRIGERLKLDVNEWKNTLSAYAEFLVTKQNTDGSWYRAYDYGGNMFDIDNTYGQKEDVAFVNADSKTCTPVPVRFLVRMYEYTREEKYLASAKKAADYVIGILVPSGKYAGSVCDGIERTDRETGIYALYGMNALYEITKDKAYLEAAEQAAVYTATWTMLTDYKIVEPNVQVGEYFKTNASVCGQSLISTGHSGVDIFMAYIYYDFFKLYLYTGNEFYYDFAYLAQNLTKRNLNWDGHLNYSEKGLCLEASYFADFDFLTAGTTGVWLPWCGNANVEPMAKMMDTFGTYDISAIKEIGREELLAQLHYYGAGGAREDV